MRSCCSQSPIFRNAGRCVFGSAEKSGIVPVKTLTKLSCRLYNRGGKRSLNEVVVPVNVKPVKNPDDIAVNEQITGGGAQSKQIVQIMNQFWKKEEVKTLAAEYGLEGTIYQQAFINFRRFCMESSPMPMDLYITFADIAKSAGRVEDLFPFFLKHAKKVFPHLECLEDLRKISDLTLPQNWYPEARQMQRKIIFHSGPTNSGKTYHALERFMNSKSGVYCGPLKLLASEVFYKTNGEGIKCDLVTGEERRYASEDKTASNHLACTVEMVSTQAPFEVAIIDEIQMIRDPQRGWAWTRALLGICAEEIHLCGEPAAVDLVKEMLLPCGEDVEVRHYKRMTPLTLADQSLKSADLAKPGDCIVCFSKNDIYALSRKLKSLGHEVAVIYGGLPPGTKLAQAQKFNDPENSCKIMVATDAVGMGLNLSIKRIVFHSLMKPHLQEDGEREMELLSTSHALQIAGRAGRFGTQFEEGEVTTFRSEDLPQLKKIMELPVDPIEKAGLYPTFDQIQMFAYHLPDATLSNLMDIFISICSVDDSKFFMCNLDDFKFLADMIQHIKMDLRARYVFCLAPINRKQPFICTMFLKFARRFADNEPLTIDWLIRTLGWPMSPPANLIDLVHLENVFDCLDTYLWLGYRFLDMFPHMELVRDMQRELDLIIQEGVFNITKLLERSESPTSSKIAEIDPDGNNFAGKLKTEAHLKKTGFMGSDAGGRYKRGSLTQRLLDEGIITQEMVAQLQDEWRTVSGRKGAPNATDTTTKSSKFPRKKRS